MSKHVVRSVPCLVVHQWVHFPSSFLFCCPQQHSFACFLGQLELKSKRDIQGCGSDCLTRCKVKEGAGLPVSRAASANQKSMNTLLAKIHVWLTGSSIATQRPGVVRIKPLSQRSWGFRAKPSTQRFGEFRTKPLSQRSDGFRTKPSTQRYGGSRTKPLTQRSGGFRAKPPTEKNKTKKKQTNKQTKKQSWIPGKAVSTAIWWIPDKAVRVSHSARSLMTRDVRHNPMKQITFIWILESDSRYCKFQQSSWWSDQCLYFRNVTIEAGNEVQHGTLSAVKAGSIGSTPGRGRTRVANAVPVSLLCAQHALRSLCTLDLVSI